MPIGWERLNDVYYRSRELYTLQWDKHLGSTTSSFNQNIISISSLTKTIAYYELNLNNHNTEIEIFSGSGKLINTINWNYHINGKIIGIEWTYDERLVVLVQSGSIRVYNNFEGDFDEYDIGYESSLVGIKAFKTFQNLVIVLLNDLKIIYFDLDKNIITSHIFKDLTLELGESLEFSSWDVLATNDSNKFHIFIGLNKLVYEVSRYGKPQQNSIDGPFQQIVVSPNGKFTAIYKKSISKVFVTSNFNKVLLDFNLKESPVEIKWCGSDAIVAIYSDYIKLIGPGGFIDFYFTNEIITTKTEFDGLTILTDQTIEFLNKISQPTIDCFKIGSTSDASILLDSIDKLNKHLPKANENLKIIGSVTKLRKAVTICLQAALDEFDSYWQKKLLKAVSFGKADIELKTADSSIAKQFVDDCNTLRVLNEIRSNDIGLYLTFTEFSHLGIERVIELLVKRQKFHESFQISKFLDLPIDSVFIEWSCCKIKYNPNLNDEELSQSIVSKFQAINNNNYISFEKIANTAFEEGRSNLAKVLINFESSFVRQIPLLLKMEEHQLALQKAIDSQNIDLIEETLLLLQESLSLPNFFKTLSNSKNASYVFEYFNYTNDQLIFDYYNQSDRILDITNREILQTFNNYENRGQDLNDEDVIKRDKVLQNAKDKYEVTMKNSNELKLIETQLSLSKLQSVYTNEFNIDFNGISLIQTLEKLILLNQNNRVNQFLKEFKISDKKFYHVKLNFLVENSKFDELYEWITSKKSPIGYEPVIKKLIQKGEDNLARKLLTKANLSYDAHVQYLIKLKDYNTAVEEATSRKDASTLSQLESIVAIPALRNVISENLLKITTTSSNLFSKRL